MVKHTVVVVVVVGGLAACGGGKKEETTPVDEGGEEVVVEDTSSGDDMIPPERMDQIQNELHRKRAVATRCLTDAIDAGEVDKNARGKVTLEFVIDPSGQARDVKVTKSALGSPMIEECVANVVRGITFGSLPRELPWSYTYAFEAF